MSLTAFSERAKLSDLTEFEKVKHIIFFLSKDAIYREATMPDILSAFDILHFARPNTSRLKRIMNESPHFVRGSSVDHFRLQARIIASLRELFPELTIRTEDIFTDGTLLPRGVYEGVPSYIERLADQINASYEKNIFDGCAVLMRRLLEILLIKTYEKLGLQAVIQSNDSTYKMLESIVSDARTNPALALSRSTKERLNDYRNLGNFAAHRIEFTTRRGDIDKIRLDYRATVEELLHKSGFKT